MEKFGTIFVNVLIVLIANAFPAFAVTWNARIADSASISEPANYPFPPNPYKVNNPVSGTLGEHTAVVVLATSGHTPGHPYAFVITNGKWEFSHGDSAVGFFAHADKIAVVGRCGSDPICLVRIPLNIRYDNPAKSVLYTPTAPGFYETTFTRLEWGVAGGTDTVDELSPPVLTLDTQRWCAKI
jgi:hypothetical protein